MNKVNFLRCLFLVGFGLPMTKGIALCSDDDCYPFIRQHTHTIRQSWSGMMSDLNAFEQGIAASIMRISDFTELYLQVNFSPATILSYPNSDVYSILDNQLQTTQNSVFSLTQTAINNFLDKDLVQHIGQKFNSLTIEPYTNAPYATNYYLNVEPFLTKTNISSNEHLSVLSFIDIVNQTLLPFSDHSSSNQQGEKEQVHMVNLWQLLSSQSLSLSNFYHALTKRIIVNDLGNNLSLSTGMEQLPDTSDPSYVNNITVDASPYDVERYQAYRRVGSASWSQDVTQANEAVLLRQQVYILAEMRRELHLKYQARERMVATMSTIFALTRRYNEILLDALHQAENAVAEVATTGGNGLPGGGGSNSGGGGTDTGGNNGGSGQGSDNNSGDSTTGSSTSSLCFIATHVYGADTWQVAKLRAFRDQYLIPHQAGRLFVGIYYTVSPELISYLHDAPVLQSNIRHALNAMVDD